jgi:hypothetical protein
MEAVGNVVKAASHQLVPIVLLLLLHTHLPQKTTQCPHPCELASSAAPTKIAVSATLPPEAVDYGHRDACGGTKRVGEIGMGEGGEHLRDLGVDVGSEAFFKASEHVVVIALIGCERARFSVVPGLAQVSKNLARLRIACHADFRVEEIAIEPVQAVAVGKIRQHAQGIAA